MLYGKKNQSIAESILEIIADDVQQIGFDDISRVYAPNPFENGNCTDCGASTFNTIRCTTCDRS